MTERRNSFFFRVCMCTATRISVEEYLVTIDRLDLDTNKDFQKKKMKKEKNMDGKTLREVTRVRDVSLEV